MSLLLLPSPRAVQPQGPVEVDWSNPLTRDLEFAEIPSFSPFTSITNGVFQGGSVIFSGGSNSSGLRFGTPKRYLGSLQQSTVITIGSTTATISVGKALFSERGTSGNDIYKIELNPDQTLTAAFVYRNDDGSLLQQRVQCVGHNDGRTITVSATKDGTTHRIGINGLYSSGTFGSGSSAFTDATLVRQLGADAADGPSAWTGPIDFTAGWARALPDEEIKSIRENPYQLFRPLQRRIWVAITGGATLIDFLSTTFSVSGQSTSGLQLVNLDSKEFSVQGLSFVNDQDISFNSPSFGVQGGAHQNAQTASLDSTSVSVNTSELGVINESSTNFESVVFNFTATSINIPLVLSISDGINNIIYRKLKENGYEGSLNEMLLRFFGSAGSLQDSERLWLISVTGVTQGSNKDLWTIYLNTLGYTGSLPDMLKDFWINY